MSDSDDKWSLGVMAAYSRQWSHAVAQQFREGVSSLLVDIERQIRVENPSIHLKPVFFSAARPRSSNPALRAPFAYAIIDVTDYDEDLAFLVGLMQGAQVPYVGVFRGEADANTSHGFSESDGVAYHEMAELFRPNSILNKRIMQAMSPARLLEQLVYEL